MLLQDGLLDKNYKSIFFYDIFIKKYSLPIGIDPMTFLYREQCFTVLTEKFS